MQALLPRATSGRVPALGSSVSRTLRLRPHSLAAATLLPPTPARTYGAVPSSPHRPLLPRASCQPPSFRLGHRKLSTTKPPPFAFAFDIDGVLLHSAKPIPGAKEALKFLTGNNIPFILLTNGGAKRSGRRQEELSHLLGLPPDRDYLVQSHTPFSELARSPLTPFGASLFPGEESLRDKNILVMGSDDTEMRHIAEEYGFRNVLTTSDIAAADPTIIPFPTSSKEPAAATTATQQQLLPLVSGGKLKIDAVFVFNDPRDWALSAQIITDLLLSEGGVLGTYSARNGRADLPGHGWQSDGQPRLYFSNPDLFWSSANPLPRFGQGAFHAALDGIWRRVTDGKASPPRCKVIGKPSRETYRYADNVLLSSSSSSSGSGSGAGDRSTSTTVYMVGDNPESDIRGANEFKNYYGGGGRGEGGRGEGGRGEGGRGGAAEWRSVLVRTGVWRPERGPPKYEPDAIVDDVRAAVEWALEREGWKGEGGIA
ncbi:Haloacid dehalogenase-like hydrolase-domain-containing protein [Biscogniauxia mediterranea]|nr:Haloacid dehalogenase-like hydrolase-domain-containing protein [Biscogniauxia mediterranea]